jgi:hypothetical protein
VVAQLTPPVPEVSAPSAPIPEIHYPDSDGQPMADNTLIDAENFFTYK